MNAHFARSVSRHSIYCYDRKTIMQQNKNEKPLTGARGLLDDLNDEEITEDTSSNVTAEERDLLAESADVTPGDEDAQQLERGTLDNEDDEGAPLNEGDEVSGNDLDVPGSELDDDNEDIGEEDEENNSYSLGGDRNED